MSDRSDPVIGDSAVTDMNGRWNTCCLILNPAACSGRTGVRADEIVRALRSYFPSIDVKRTSGPRDGLKLAQEAAGKFDLVIAAGGDGTVHDIASGLLDNPSTTHFAVLPLGTGNDFARMIGMPVPLLDAVTALKDGVPVPVDAGHIAWVEGNQIHKSFFVNALGVGFDGYAASLAPRYKHLPFHSGYLVTVLRALLNWKPVEVKVEDMGPGSRVSFGGKIFMITVGNASDSGGGFRINPRASLTDSLLDVCLVKEISLFRALRLLPTAARGAHIGLPEILYWQTRGLSIHTDHPIPIHADGEVISLAATEISIGIRAAALSVLVPRNMQSRFEYHQPN